MAKVSLVRPPVQVPKWSDSGPLTPPIGPAYLAAALRAKSHSVSIVDGLGESPFQMTSLYDNKVIAIGLKIEEIVERVKPDSEIIGISCMFSQDWPYIRLLVQQLRKQFPSALIVAGGEHITAVGEFTLKNCPEIDYCVAGEGEETAVSLADHYDGTRCYGDIPGLLGRFDGEINYTGDRERIKEIDNIAPPAWDLVPLSNYLDNGLGYGVNLGRNMPIIATRGCPYQCTFCSNPDMWTTAWYARNPALVLEEMVSYQERYDVTNFDFYDLTAIVKRKWIIQFTDLILSQENRFYWQLPSGTRSEALDEEVCRRLYLSGCRNISYAPESGSPAVLKRIKKFVKLKRLEKSVKGAVHNRLNIKLNIIIGFPDESEREIKETIRFLIRMAILGVHDAAIAQFSPYPGSELFSKLRKEQKIPELTDEYFLSLGAYKDFSSSFSYADKISPEKQNYYRLLGLFLFYSVQYLVRPWRFIWIIYNFIRGKQQSRLDKSLQDLATRAHSTSA